MTASQLSFPRSTSINSRCRFPSRHPDPLGIGAKFIFRWYAPRPATSDIVHVVARHAALFGRNRTIAQRNPRRSVIARLLASAVLGIHTRRSQSRLQRRTEQKEIEPHAFVLAERIVVYPVRVHALGRVELPCGVHPALSQ